MSTERINMPRRICCPLCDWFYEVPDIDPRAVDPLTLAEVFGMGVFAMHARNEQAHRTEAQLANHFSTHKTVEWVRALTEERAKKPMQIDAQIELAVEDAKASGDGWLHVDVEGRCVRLDPKTIVFKLGSVVEISR